jgi:defect-in-organelle-trafficking protein DotD
MKCALRRSAISLALTAPFVLGGCAQNPPVDLEVDPAVVKLSEAADEISRSYQMLSYAESSEAASDGAGRDMNYEISEFPAEWQEEFVLEEDFYGELEPFLRGLSRLAGYQEPQIIGRRPVVPVTVTLNRDKKALAEFLIDASYQAGTRATVTLNPDKSRLLITYPQ